MSSVQHVSNYHEGSESSVRSEIPIQKEDYLASALETLQIFDKAKVELKQSENEIILIIEQKSSDAASLLSCLTGFNIFPKETEDNSKRINEEDQNILSATNFPYQVQDNHFGLNYWNCVNFKALKEEPFNEIIYAFFIKCLVSSAQKMKIILTISYNSLEKSPMELTREIERLRKLFSDSDLLNSNLLLIITQVPVNKNLDAIKGKIQSVLAKVNEFKTKEILQKIIKDPTRMEIFRSFDDPSQKEQASKFIFKIRNLPFYQTESIHIGVSKESKALVKMLVESLLEIIDSKIKTIIEEIEELYETKVMENTGINDYVLLRSLHKLIKQVSEAPNLIQLVEYVEILIEKHFPKLQSSYKLGNIMQLVLYLLQVTPEVDFNGEPWYAKFESLEEQLDELMSVEAEIRDRILTINGIFISMARIKKYLKKKESFSLVEIFCLSTIFFDESIDCEGVNFTIIAPQWIVNGKRTINLSGADSLVQPPSIHLDGSPGQPGKSSGSFFGIGKSFKNIEDLTIKANGGKGGPGGHGKDGENGKDGTDARKDSIESRNEMFLINRERIEVDNNEPIYKRILAAKYKETYRSRGTWGENGTRGGAGGRGGFGGHAGRIHLISLENEVGPIMEKFEGERGSDGSPGRPGNGGKGGMSYYGVYISQQTLGIKHSQNEWESGPSSYFEEDGLDGERIEELNGINIQRPLQINFNFNEGRMKDRYRDYFHEKKKAYGFRYIRVAF